MVHAKVSSSGHIHTKSIKVLQAWSAHLCGFRPDTPASSQSMQVKTLN